VGILTSLSFSFPFLFYPHFIEFDFVGALFILSQSKGSLRPAFF